MMKVLIINGSPHKVGTTFKALSIVESKLKEAGIETTWVNVPSDTASCMACGYCKRNGECIKKDLVNETYKLLDECDGLLVGSPVYYAGPSGSLTSFLDRLFYSYPNSRTLNLKAAAAISNSRRAGNLTSNDVLNKFFSISGMSIITSSYWNDPHGNKPEELDNDLEAIQTLENLGNNMAYYLKLRKLGEDNGLESPKLKKENYTNFVR